MKKEPINRTEHTAKQSSAGVITVGALYILLFACGIAFVWLRKLTNLEPDYIFNIAIDLFGMAMGIVLFAACIIDVQKTGSYERDFLNLLSVTFLGLFTDLVAWIVDGLPALRAVNILDNTIYYICTPLGTFLFWRYVTRALMSDSRLDQILDRVMKALLELAVFVRILNAFLGFYFTVDSAGVYHRSSLYPLSTVYTYLVLLASCILIITHRKKLDLSQTVILLIYVAAPTAVSIFRVAVYGLSLSFSVIMLVLLLMYCSLNIDQGRKKMIADRELKTASEIQEGMLPSIFPAFPNRPEFDIYASMDPAREVGGDFYDFFLVDDDHLCIVMADVSGKGVPAALLMMASKIILANHAMMGKSPGEILTDANVTVFANNKMDLFVTVWLGILEISTGKLTASNAGHEYPVIRRPGGDFDLYKDPHGFVLGSFEDECYEEYEERLEPGSKIFVYTDGVPEAMDRERQQFGLDRMLAALNRDPDASPYQLLKNVRDGVQEFVGDAEQFDDLTMLCLEYKGPAD